VENVSGKEFFGCSGNGIFSKHSIQLTLLFLKERQDKLNELGFVWKRYGIKKPGEKRKDPDTTKLDARWMSHYDKLKVFFEENGHSNLLQDHPDQPLYFWFKTQRTLMHQGLLREDRKQMLDKLNLIWDTKETLNLQWEEKFRHASEYKKEHGTINCPHRLETHGLGSWIAYQKRSFREGLIEPDRARRLLEADMTYIAEKDYSWLVTANAFCCGRPSYILTLSI
jgi:Helicase associated domain